LKRSWQNFTKILIYAERSGLSQFPQIEQTGHVPIVITPNLLTIWSREMNHQKAERVT
jgi:hypothetical protein